jgi:hypothetical protein
MECRSRWSPGTTGLAGPSGSHVTREQAGQAFYGWGFADELTVMALRGSGPTIPSGSTEARLVATAEQPPPFNSCISRLCTASARWSARSGRLFCTHACTPRSPSGTTDAYGERPKSETLEVSDCIQQASIGDGTTARPGDPRRRRNPGGAEAYGSTGSQAYVSLTGSPRPRREPLLSGSR